MIILRFSHGFSLFKVMTICINLTFTKKVSFIPKIETNTNKLCHLINLVNHFLKIVYLCALNF